ncbi:MAG TPA: NAD-dependent epimerase/dehydratase family protein [Anaerolineae bacterium]|nr:NAD-dependent epimerase/dehydratase family protein [Anaerolineae bacterium]
MNILVTGSSGLIGSEAVTHFDSLGHAVYGLDNNMRLDFFGPQGDTSWNLERLRQSTRAFTHFSLDIRNRQTILGFFEAHRIGAVIHCAAQPSHDLSRSRPLDDFDVNAVGTANLLEAARRTCPQAPFVFMSTNKVYGDAPNEIPMVEMETRWDYRDAADYHGIGEECRIDRSTHSIFGASKAAADLLVQEYGRYYNMPTACFRGGCLTGPRHSGVELHGFLSYLLKVAVRGERYTIFGYKGKQVRDQIHSHDVVRAFDAFIQAPRAAAVYNIGGGRANSASILECFAMIEQRLGRPVDHGYEERNRQGDHICYISDLHRLKADYPAWGITRSLDDIVDEMLDSEFRAQGAAGA